MKFAIDQKDLDAGLKLVERAVASRSTLPILGNICIHAWPDKGTISLAATDLERYVQVWVRAEVEAEGAITLPAGLFKSFVRSLPNNSRIAATLDAATATATLDAGSFHAAIHGLGVDDWPQVSLEYSADASDETRSVTLPAAHLQDLLRCTLFAASPDDSRPTLQTVQLTVTPEWVQAVATDGYRLSIRRIPHDDSVDLGSAMLPKAPLTDALKVLDALKPEQTTIALTPNQFGMYVVVDDEDNPVVAAQVTGSLVDGRYPDVWAIIPTTRNTQVRFALDEATRAVKVANLFADTTHRIDLQIERNGDPAQVFSLKAQSVVAGTANVDIAAEIEGDDINISLDARYLADLFGALAGTESKLVMEMTSPTRPLLFYPSDLGREQFMHVIMPMYGSR